MEDGNGDSVVKQALSQATVKLRQTLLSGSEVLSPDTSEKISIDPVLSSFFGIEHADSGVADKVSTVEEWLASQHCKTYDEKLSALRTIQTRMGEAGGGSSLDKMYHYVVLTQQATKLHRQADALMK